MKFLSLFFYLGALAGFSLNAQQTASEKPGFARFQTGTFASYIWDETDRYTAWTWGGSGLFFLHPQFGLGVQAQIIRAGDTLLGNQNYAMGGLLAHYEFWNGPRAGFFAEAGLFRGNMCSCGEGNPYRRRGLNMLMLSAGMMFHIGRNFNQHLDLQLSFATHDILQKIQGKYGHNIYRIGLAYRFPAQHDAAK